MADQFEPPPSKPAMTEMSESEVKAMQEKVSKYAKRFVTVYNNILNKEQVEPDILQLSMQTAICVEALSLILERGAKSGANINQIEASVKQYMHGFNELMIGHFEMMANQLIQLEQEKKDATTH